MAAVLLVALVALYESEYHMLALVLLPRSARCCCLMCLSESDLRKVLLLVACIRIDSCCLLLNLFLCPVCQFVYPDTYGCLLLVNTFYPHALSLTVGSLAL